MHLVNKYVYTQCSNQIGQFIEQESPRALNHTPESWHIKRWCIGTGHRTKTDLNSSPNEPKSLQPRCSGELKNAPNRKLMSKICVTVVTKRNCIQDIIFWPDTMFWTPFPPANWIMTFNHMHFNWVLFGLAIREFKSASYGWYSRVAKEKSELVHKVL